ncbi:MAG: alcohol acetyltransferase [Ruminococcaceae bacterium]|nr:alcohol acetyltransferase [Oscillospiraceae bacterium]
MEKERQLTWMRLDNAAKIYPAARKRSWNCLFRLSASLNESIDSVVMQKALEVTVKRFPSIAVRIRRGAFWYYLEEIANPPSIKSEAAYPMARMSFKDIRKCAFRVVCHKNRLAVEFYHALTDGSGGLAFLKTLLAEYLTQKYGVNIPPEKGVLDVKEKPKKCEIEDSFLKNDGPVSSSRSEATAYRLRGTLENDGYLNLVTGILDVKAVLSVAKQYNATLTEFLTAAMIYSIINIQNRTTPNKKRQKPVKILVPVNLRKIFGSETLRNFALYVTPGIDPRLGEYTFEEIVKSVHHQMGYEINAKNLAAKIAANVGAERSFILKIMPLFIKNIAMKTVFNLFGERKSSITISNLGAVEIPDEMKLFVTRFDFILGEQALCTNACSVVSYNGKLNISFLRIIRESEVEKEFFSFLRKLGLNIKIESNKR